MLNRGLYHKCFSSNVEIHISKKTGIPICNTCDPQEKKSFEINQEWCT